MAMRRDTRLVRDEVCDLCRGDLLERCGFDTLRGSWRLAINGLQASLAVGVRDDPARDLQTIADRPEGFAEVVDVGLSALGRLDRADVLDVRGEHFRDRRARG